LTVIFSQVHVLCYLGYATSQLVAMLPRYSFLLGNAKPASVNKIKHNKLLHSCKQVSSTKRGNVSQDTPNSVYPHCH